MNLTLVKKAAIAVLAAGSIAGVAAPALATPSQFGPQSWSNGTQTARYRAHAALHYITLLNCNGTYTVDLRVDVINQPDVSEGKFAYGCNNNYQTGGHYDSFNTAYRGHYMQSGSVWYGTAKDNHS